MAEFMQSLSTCNPPSRFLALDTTVGRWQPLSDAYVVQKIDATLRTIAIILNRAVRIEYWRISIL